MNGEKEIVYTVSKECILELGIYQTQFAREVGFVGDTTFLGEKCTYSNFVELSYLVACVHL